MRAIVYERTGEPDVLCAADIPTPIPTADEVRVQVLAIAVDYVQLHLRRGGSGRASSSRRCEIQTCLARHPVACRRRHVVRRRQ